MCIIFFRVQLPSVSATATHTNVPLLKHAVGKNSDLAGLCLYIEACLSCIACAGLAANGDELPAPAGSSSNGAQPNTVTAPGNTGSVRFIANGALSADDS